MEQLAITDPNHAPVADRGEDREGVQHRLAVRAAPIQAVRVVVEPARHIEHFCLRRRGRWARISGQAALGAASEDFSGTVVVPLAASEAEPPGRSGAANAGAGKIKSVSRLCIGAHIRLPYLQFGESNEFTSELATAAVTGFASACDVGFTVGLAVGLAVGNSVGNAVGDEVAHTRSVMAVAEVTSCSSTPHVVRSSHSRSADAVGALVSYCAAVHTVTSVQAPKPSASE
jgi:hypothetical protein